MAQPVSAFMLPQSKKLTRQSDHELELGYSGEIDLHEHVICKKNPGHHDFIPIQSLEHRQIDTTPLSNTEITKFCQYAAKWTVKLKMQCVSSKRSRISNYPLSANAGERVTTFGSGCVTGIDASGDEGSFPCPLEKCPHSTEPHQVYGYIIITTAAHVVFDTEEAKETIVEFFDDHPTDKSTVGMAHGFSVKIVDIHEDNCELMCITHSVPLFHQISQMVAQCPTRPDIFRFANYVESMPTFISLVSALADIRDSSSQSRLNNLCHNVRHEVETIFTYLKINEVSPDSEEVKAFLLKAEQVTQQTGLMEKVLGFLSSKKTICDFTEISFQVLIEKVSILGAVSLLSTAQKQRLSNFVRDFFRQIVDCMNEITRSTYQDTSNYIDNTIAVHISHPHGQSKQVSLGKYFSSKTKDGQRKHIYTVPTCNGCSGGPVWILPGGHDRKVRWEQVYGVPHGGCFDRVNNLNHSSSQVFGVLQLKMILDSLNIRPYGHVLKNIEHYQHLLHIGPCQDLPNIRCDLHVKNFIEFSHPQWQDPGFTLSQQNLFFDLNQELDRPQSDLHSLVPEPGQSPYRPGSDLNSQYMKSDNSTASFRTLSPTSVLSEDSVHTLIKAPSVLSDDSLLTLREAPSILSDDSVLTLTEAPLFLSDDSVHTSLEAPSVLSDSTVLTLREAPSVLSDDSVLTLTEAPSVLSDDSVLTLREAPSVLSEDSVLTLREAPSVLSEDSVLTLREAPSVLSEDSVPTLLEAPLILSDDSADTLIGAPSVFSHQSNHKPIQRPFAVFGRSVPKLSKDLPDALDKVQSWMTDLDINVNMSVSSSGFPSTSFMSSFSPSHSTGTDAIQHQQQTFVSSMAENDNSTGLSSQRLSQLLMQYTTPEPLHSPASVDDCHRTSGQISSTISPHNPVSSGSGSISMSAESMTSRSIEMHETISASSGTLISLDDNVHQSPTKRQGQSPQEKPQSTTNEDGKIEVSNVSGSDNGSGRSNVGGSINNNKSGSRRKKKRDDILKALVIDKDDLDDELPRISSPTVSSGTHTEGSNFHSLEDKNDAEWKKSDQLLEVMMPKQLLGEENAKPGEIEAVEIAEHSRQSSLYYKSSVSGSNRITTTMSGVTKKRRSSASDDGRELLHWLWDNSDDEDINNNNVTTSAPAESTSMEYDGGPTSRPRNQSEHEESQSTCTGTTYSPPCTTQGQTNLKTMNSMTESMQQDPTDPQSRQLDELPYSLWEIEDIPHKQQQQQQQQQQHQMPSSCSSGSYSGSSCAKRRKVSLPDVDSGDGGSMDMESSTSGANNVQ